MRYRITHRTQYTCSERISVGHNEAWLTPRNTPTQTCLTHQIEIVPTPSVIVTRIDAFENTTTQFAFNQGYDTLTVHSLSEVEVCPAVSEEFSSPAWELVRDAVFAHGNAETYQALEFVFDSPRCRASPDLAAYAELSFPKGRPIREAVGHLMQRLHGDWKYDPTATNVTTPVEQVFHHRRGVCQDFAHLMISMLRAMRISARYVSGYLRTHSPPGKPHLVGADASHAWVSVYCGPLGWIDLDPTNNQFISTDHITVAWGRDYMDVAPLKGVYVGRSSPRMLVSVDVCEMADERIQTEGGLCG